MSQVDFFVFVSYYYNALGSGTGANVTNAWPGPTAVNYGTSTSTSCGNSSLWTL